MQPKSDAAMAAANEKGKKTKGKSVLLTDVQISGQVSGGVTGRTVEEPDVSIMLAIATHRFRW